MKKKVLSLAACFSLVTLFSCNGQKGKADMTLKNAADSASYAIGVSIGTNMKKDGLETLNLEILKGAMESVLLHKNKKKRQITILKPGRNSSKKTRKKPVLSNFLMECNTW